MIVGPQPPLDFDETMQVLQAVLTEEYVVVMVIEEGRGNPAVTLRGWLHLEVDAAGASLTVRRYADEEVQESRRLGKVLCVSRSAFRVAGEAPEADPPGPLTLVLRDRTVIIDGIDRAPDWEQLEHR